MYQRITIIGTVGKTPEPHETSKGTPVTSFPVVTERKWTTAEGEREEKLTWFTVSAWGKLADIAVEFLKEGYSVLVEGEMEQARGYMVNGQCRAQLEVRARVIRCLK